MQSSEKQNILQMNECMHDKRNNIKTSTLVSCALPEMMVVMVVVTRVVGGGWGRL